MIEAPAGLVGGIQRDGLDGAVFFCAPLFVMFVCVFFVVFLVLRILKFLFVPGVVT